MKTREQLLHDFYAARGTILAAVPQPPGAAPVGGPAAPVAPETAPPAAPEADAPNETICANPECGHMASAHADIADGDNLGACSMQNCTCAAMVMPDGETPEPPDAESPDAAPEPKAAASATTQAFADGEAPGDGGEAPGDGDSGVVPLPVDQETSAGSGTGGPGDTPDPGALPVMGPAFTIPVLVIEGVETSDDREIAPNALTWRDPPLPLMGLDTTSEFGHEGAVICGRIDSITRDGTTLSATGFLLADENGLHFADLIAIGAITGVSVDIGDVDSSIGVTGMDLDGFPTDTVEILMAGQIMGATICPFPAFAGAYIQLDGTDVDPSIPMQQPTAAQAARGINVLSVRECEPCKSGVVVASAGPLAPPAGWFAPVDAQGRPGFDELTPLTVTDDGHVFGHIAPFGVCHIGVQGECVMAPKSSSSYALFHQGSVVCSDGSIVATGPITMNAEHASSSGRLTAAQARAHYDNTATRFADVHAGEDQWGVWVAGSVDPSMTDEDVRRFRGSGVSGDWRWVGRGHELVAALAVNTPGFPVVTASLHNGQVMAIVAAGAPQMLALARSRAIDPIEARMERMERAQNAFAPIAHASLTERFRKIRGR